VRLQGDRRKVVQPHLELFNVTPATRLECHRPSDQNKTALHPQPPGRCIESLTATFFKTGAQCDSTPEAAGSVSQNINHTTFIHTMAPNWRRLSLYPPRRRRSTKLVLVWMGTLVTLLLVIYYFTSRHPEAAGRFREMVKGEKDRPGSGRENH
jgi:hypothetical protein